MKDSLDVIAQELSEEISGQLLKSGLMFRIFCRAKTIDSIRHKINVKYAGVEQKPKILDAIGIRIVTYFQDDIDALSLYYSISDVVKKAIDEPDTSTFRPQRLNLTRRLPEHLIDRFHAALPSEFAEMIDDTYEIQIRTVFSEGWHEVEHDLRYKCQSDWKGCEQYSRVLNGIIATLETAEWNMKSLFNDMAKQNLAYGNYTAMLRNKLHIRMRGEGLSEEIEGFLKSHPAVAEQMFNTDRMIIVYTLLAHKGDISLTYDNLAFLINRIEIMNPEFMALENEETARMLDCFLES